MGSDGRCTSGATTSDSFVEGLRLLADNHPINDTASRLSRRSTGDRLLSAKSVTQHITLERLVSVWTTRLTDSVF